MVHPKNDSPKSCRSGALGGSGFSKPFLDGPREVFLPPQLDVGVVVGHIHVAMAGDLTGLNRACAHFLPPRNIGSAERMHSKTVELAASGRASFSAFWTPWKEPMRESLSTGRQEALPIHRMCVLLVYVSK